MSRDILIIGGIASVMHRSPTDTTYLPVDDSVDVSVISEEDWHNLVGTPGKEDSFNTSEQSYLISLGCTWDAL
jgi:hypothetical protein